MCPALEDEFEDAEPVSLVASASLLNVKLVKRHASHPGSCPKRALPFYLTVPLLSFYHMLMFASSGHGRTGRNKVGLHMST